MLTMEGFVLSLEERRYHRGSFGILTSSSIEGARVRIRTG